MGRLHRLLAMAMATSASVGAAQEVASPDSSDPPAVVRTYAYDERVTIPILIDGKGPWNFVIDTGSQRTVIARDLARQLALPARNNVTILSMTGRSEAGTVALPDIDFGGGRIRDIEAPVLDGEHLGAPGLLGLDSLHEKRVTLNFRTGQMEIARSGGRIRPPVADRDAIVVEARRRRGQLILLHSDVNGMRVNIMLDTGASVSIGNLALRDKLVAKKRAPELVTAVLTSVTGGTLIGQVGRIKSARMGGVTLADLPVIFADASPFAELGLEDKLALLLGIGALRVFDRVAIDFGRGKVDFLLPDAMAPVKTRLAAAN